jgi:hypothetical protein
MAKVSLKTLQDAVLESQVWKSIFRHGYVMNRRNRLLAITNNVFTIFFLQKLPNTVCVCASIGVLASSLFIYFWS